ncbi:zeta toxin family protein [Gordonia phosphorivorans]|uniref:UDP-N-acetylglucosamine kinase n=1 Tax=Gordonia phosphorivorans TaxID=1056982 RepID=A0ABV6H7N6_9ACTN
MSNPRLDLVVGCNGAGKTTLIRTLLTHAIPGSALVNADDIAAARYPDNAAAMAYEAAQIADIMRQQLIAAKVSFIAETVFSHPSKLDLIGSAHAAGFRVFLHVVTIPEDLAVSRVARRVTQGGHSVPEDKVRGRYQRVWGHAARAIALADGAYIYNNEDSTMSRVAVFDQGQLIRSGKIPEWLPADLRRLLND